MSRVTCPKCGVEYSNRGIAMHLRRKIPCTQTKGKIVPEAKPRVVTQSGLFRLNYIGCKSKLLTWIHEKMLEKTKMPSLRGLRIADLFAGTGSVSYYFRENGCAVICNDSEPYSAIIAESATMGVFNKRVQAVICQLNSELSSKMHVSGMGYMTKNYSEYMGCERMYFSVDNAMRIDYCRKRIPEICREFSKTDTAFIWATLLCSADAVGNVPAVYGCYLKTIKKKALRPLVLRPVHTKTTPPCAGSAAYNLPVSHVAMAEICVDIAYLDPPYNTRQYSKNYFPLNMILRSSDKPLLGKTGIPEDCYMSPFCRTHDVHDAFRNLIKQTHAKWIFLSYSSEGIVSQKDMLDILAEFGDASVSEIAHRRFKSSEQTHESKWVAEYLFCLCKF